VAEERRRRRRGHRRGRKENGPEAPPEDRQDNIIDEPEAEEEDEEPSEGRRFGVPFLSRGRDDDEDKEKERRKEQQRSGSHPRVSPLGFWRRGSARAYREEPMPQQGLGRTMRRLRGMYFPPWVPVAFIIVVVFGILGALFFVRSAAGKPHIGEDHWHATYSVFICGQRQPNFPEWAAGVHTHADGIIHIHPFVAAEEGAGARLVKWFEYGGGRLTQSEMHMPGTPKDEVYKNGDECPDGTAGLLQVFVNDEKLDNWNRYIPQDGDQVRIVFGPEEAVPQELEDRTVIDPASAGRTEELEITGAEGDAAFTQDSIDLKVGETVKFDITNSGSISHGVRAAGADGEYNTADDYVSEPEIIEPGETGVLVVLFETPGEFEFQDPSAPAATGTFVVSEEGDEGEEETPEDEVETDVTLEVTMTDNAFAPKALEVEAGQSFRINLTNEGSFVHNMRIAGPDGEFETEDDIVSTPADPKAGEDGTLVGTIEKTGKYQLRSDFQPTEMTGTITVK
jgi:plastocyanin